MTRLVHREIRVMRQQMNRVWEHIFRHRRLQCCRRPRSAPGTSPARPISIGRAFAVRIVCGSRPRSRRRCGCGRGSVLVLQSQLSHFLGNGQLCLPAKRFRL